MDLNQKMSLVFALESFPIFWILKFVSLSSRGFKIENPLRFFFLTPLISASSWEKSKPRDRFDYMVILRKTSFYVLILCLVSAVEWKISDGWRTPYWLNGYLAGPMVLLIGEIVSRLTQLISLLSGRMIPDFHVMPLLSKNLPEFWGKRWNTWVSDWFREVIGRRTTHCPKTGLFFVFFLSGLAHEVMFNLPYQLISGNQPVYGTMLAYYLIQFVGMVLDRAWFAEKKDHAFRCFFGWIVIIAPCPLMLTPVVLRILHLWPSV